MSHKSNDAAACGDECGCHSAPLSIDITRRDVLKVTGLGALALLSSHLPAVAGPFQAADFADDAAPGDKKLSVDWLKSLAERGSATVYRGGDLEKIGMPVGGIAAGQLYLGGDGRLWHWDIFNRYLATTEEHYVHPLQPDAPNEDDVAQGFALLINGKTHRLDATRDGFSDVSFCGQYPIGTVTYADKAVPLAVTLEAFSPFVPLNVDDSSLPATVMRFTVSNVSGEVVEASLLGWLQNATCLFHLEQAEVRRNRVRHESGVTLLEMSADAPPTPSKSDAPDLVFEDWNKTTYDGWRVEGTAFGSGPILKKDMPAYQGDVGGDTERVVNSHATAPLGARGDRDDATGKLTSHAFQIERNYLNFWIGGGSRDAETALNLVVDGKIVRSASGGQVHRMLRRNFNVAALRGKTAILEIVDAAQGEWGNIGVGKITQSDTAVSDYPDHAISDFGDMTLALLGAPAQHVFARFDPADLLASTRDAARADEAAAAPEENLIGALGRKFRLAPKQKVTIDFVLSWRFPHLWLIGFPEAVGRQYATRFASSAQVARYVAKNFARLARDTKLWRDTFYDSSLPHWLLERTFANASTLATSTAHRFANGRFYGWEGVGCCLGTCTHVWQYEQTMGRIFPELDINLRENVDYKLGVGFHENGVIDHRGNFNYGPAVDGQAGTILRTLRDHQMSPDDAFLKRNWPHIKKAVEWMIAQDGDASGVWEGAQHNTLDAEWFGEVAWLSGLYLAGLAAGAQMADETGDADFASLCRTVLAAGQKNFVPKMWNGEYFIQVADPTKLDKVGSYNGCEIDQVFGQSWAWQVGLGQVLPQKETRAALQALWRYNFTPDGGPYRAKHPSGRWYAVAGEAGTLMCSWPRGEAQRVKSGFDFYLNECMNGFEHQVAGHMIWEGMVQEGLAIERAVHDRYHAARRNPWNEVECGDHYARSMASYGVFLAACGYEYHGPKGHLAFAPKLSPENFRAAFTAAEGWGSFAQKIGKTSMQAEVALKYGALRLQTLALQLPENLKVKTVKATLDGKLLDGKLLDAKFSRDDERITVTFSRGVSLKAGQKLSVRLA